MDKCPVRIVPIHKLDKFSQIQCSKNELELKVLKSIPYALVVRSLMFDQTCTRPDTSFAISMLG